MGSTFRRRWGKSSDHFVAIIFVSKCTKSQLESVKDGDGKFGSSKSTIISDGSKIQDLLNWLETVKTRCFHLKATSVAKIGHCFLQFVAI